MRKIVAGFAASVDGYIEGPNKEYDWIIVDPSVDFSEHMNRYDIFLYGRITYEAAKKMGTPSAKQKHIVISHTLEQVDKGYTLLKGDLFAELLALKSGTGKDIALFGGASLLSSLLDLGLVDRIEISFIPVLLGKGKPMAEPLRNKVPLSFDSTETLPNGTVIIKYNVNTASPKA